MTVMFEPALRGRQVWLELSNGCQLLLPVNRWHTQPGPADEVLLQSCSGSTMDLGCGPGRLTAALRQRGVPALGVDISPHAVALARNRGATALCRNVFDPLPDEGRWRHVLLADGNIGIGGNPVSLLRRARKLLCPNGSALIELDKPGTGLRQGRARMSGGSASDWFDWAWLGVDAFAPIAQETSFEPLWVVEHSGRWFGELRKL